MPYADAYRWMHELAERRVADEIPDTLLLLEHPPVFTAGRRSMPEHLLLAEDQLKEMGAELHEVDRGGSVTFHGPGQLVGYPIVKLQGKPDVMQYLRDLEEVVIRAGADLGVEGLHRSDVNTGVWAGDKKICAIGVKTTRGVTLHGFALNCTTDLSWFAAIVPCGLEGYGVGTLSQLAGREISVEEALPVVTDRFQDLFGLSFALLLQDRIEAEPAAS